MGKKKKAQPLTPYQTAMQELAAYEASAPRVLETNQQYLPAFARLDNQIALDTADQLAAGNLDLQRKYMPDYLAFSRDMATQADPNRVATYDELGSQVLANLKMGNSLTDLERQQVEQSVRGGQSARGNLWGTAPAVMEALNVGQAATLRGQQRQRDALAFLNGENPANAFGGINLNYDAPEAGGGVSTGDILGGGQGYANADLQAQQYNASRTNPWLQALGQIGGTYAGVKIAQTT